MAGRDSGERAGGAADWFEQIQPRDFDGHTEFARMTVEERVSWLSSGARFLVSMRGAVQKARDEGDAISKLP